MGVAKAALERRCATSRPTSARGTWVNAISAGPIKTLAASGIGDFRYILKWNEYKLAAAPATSPPTTSAARPLPPQSDLSAVVTGEVHHVDAATTWSA